jgi:hypothetical protein
LSEHFYRCLQGPVIVVCDAPTASPNRAASSQPPADGRKRSRAGLWQDYLAEELLVRFPAISGGPLLSRLADSMAGMERLSQQRLALASTAAELPTGRRRALFQMD